MITEAGRLSLPGSWGNYFVERAGLSMAVGGGWGGISVCSGLLGFIYQLKKGGHAVSGSAFLETPSLQHSAMPQASAQLDTLPTQPWSGLAEVWFLAYESKSWACSSHLFRNLLFSNQKEEKHCSHAEAEKKSRSFNLEPWYIISTWLVL